jgi:hypothetical protein
MVELRRFVSREPAHTRSEQPADQKNRSTSDLAAAATPRICGGGPYQREQLGGLRVLRVFFLPSPTNPCESLNERRTNVAWTSQNAGASFTGRQGSIG